jgi:hypothetical protein
MPARNASRKMPRVVDQDAEAAEVSTACWINLAAPSQSAMSRCRQQPCRPAICESSGRAVAMATRRPDNSRSECGGRLIVAVVRAVADKGYAATTISDGVDRGRRLATYLLRAGPDKETASSRRSTPAWRWSSRGWASRPCSRLARFARRNVPAAHRRHGRVDPRMPAGLGRSGAGETHRARRTGHIQAACRRLSSEPEESNTGGALPTGRALASDPGATQAAIWARELKPSLVTRFSTCPSPVRASRIGDATGPRRRALRTCFTDTGWVRGWRDRPSWNRPPRTRNSGCCSTSPTGS